MKRWGAAVVLVLLAACSPDQTDDATQTVRSQPATNEPQMNVDGSPATDSGGSGDQGTGTTQDEETVATVEEIQAQPGVANEALSPVEVEQAFVVYARCLAAEADHLKLRFRADPLYGVLKEIGANDPTGQREDELDRRCTAASSIDVIIGNYQASNPPRPEQVAEIIEAYGDCVSSVPGSSDRLLTVATMDDISLAQGDLLAMVSDQNQGQLVIDCTETALYGPVLDTEQLG